MNGEIKIEEIKEIEAGALGVRVTLVDGKRRFIEGKEVSLVMVILTPIYRS